MIRRRAIARNATRSGLAIWCMSVRHVSLPCLTSSRTCTRPPLVYEAQCTDPIHQALSAKDLAPREHFVDGAYISAALLATSRDDYGITLAAPRGRSKAGKPRPTGPTISPSSRSIGSSGRPAVRRARSRPSGGSTLIARASRIPSSGSASRIAAPVRPGRCARGPRRRGAASISRRRSALKRCKRREPGMPVRRGSNATNVARDRRDPVARRAGLRPPPNALSGHRENALTARGHRRCD